MRAPVLIIGHSGEAAARSLVAAWPGGGARLLTPANFFRSRLSWRADAKGRAVSAIGATPVDVDSISGVVTLIDGVFASDLPQVAPADRVYVAGEMTAFLSVWLHTLPCPKLNPPSLTSLCGQKDFLLWRAHALACGLSAPSVDVSAPLRRDDAALRLTIIGDRALGSTDREAIGFARALSDRTRLPMLSLRLERTPDGFAFAGATALPDVNHPEIAEAVFAFFGEAER
jgi:hypothetical protein